MAETMRPIDRSMRCYDEKCQRTECTFCLRLPPRHFHSGGKVCILPRPFKEIFRS